jgi:hypothetical protein
MAVRFAFALSGWPLGTMNAAMISSPTAMLLTVDVAPFALILVEVPVAIVSMPAVVRDGDPVVLVVLRAPVVLLVGRLAQSLLRASNRIAWNRIASNRPPSTRPASNRFASNRAQQKPSSRTIFTSAVKLVPPELAALVTTPFTATRCIGCDIECDTH